MLPRSSPPFLPLPPVDTHRCGNGLDVWSAHIPEAPLVAVQLALPAGAEHDPPGRAGLAMAATEGMGMGTGDADAIAVNAQFERYGANHHSSIGLDGALVALIVPQRTFHRAMAFMADLVRKPSFPAADISRLLERQQAALRQRADRPAAVASRAFHQLLYGPDHPYGSDPQGTPESLGAIVRDELVQFHAAHVGPVHSTMVVVGPYSQEESREAITELFDAWGQSPSVAPPHLALTDERPHPLYIVDRPGAVQTEIRFGRAGYSRTSPEYVALTVANRILGGQFTSRLNANLREKRGWTYGIGSSFRFHRGPGPFVISTAVDSARTGEALDEIIGELRRLCEGGCTEEEVQSARTGLSGGFVVGLETPAQYAAALAGAAMFDLGPDYLETHREQLSRITVDEVNAAARHSLWPDDMTIVLHGDRGMLEAQKSITAFRPVAVDIGTIMGTSRRQ